MAAPQAQPGWYPQGDGQQRYWDGSAWTEHRAPVDPPPPEAFARSNPQWVAWVLGALLILPLGWGIVVFIR